MLYNIVISQCAALISHGKPDRGSELLIQGVPKLIDCCSKSFNIEPNNPATMANLPMHLLLSQTQSLMPSGIPHIRLSSVSALMRRQAFCRLLTSVCSEVAGSILSSSPGRWPRYFRWATGQGCCPAKRPSPRTPGGWRGTTPESWPRCEPERRPAGKRLLTSSAEV